MKRRRPVIWRTTSHYLHNRQRGIIRPLPRQAWILIRSNPGSVVVSFTPHSSNYTRTHVKKVSIRIESGKEKVVITDRPITISPDVAAVVEVEIWRWPK